jgi:hypothetical protein
LQTCTPAHVIIKIFYKHDVSLRCVLSNLPGVHTLAAMGLLWALEKGYYATHV